MYLFDWVILKRLGLGLVMTPLLVLAHPSGAPLGSLAHLETAHAHKSAATLDPEIL
jgi:hypothetical protein